MKKYYILTTFFLFTIAFLNAQAEAIYDAPATPGAAFGTPFSSTANGTGSFSGDGVILAGTNRVITQISVAGFQRTDTTFLPIDITVRLYTDCPSNMATGECGANGAGSLIPGSEVVHRINADPNIGFINIPMPNVDVSSEADDTIWVMFNVPSNDFLGVVNGVAVTGMDATSEINALSRCGTFDNNSCADVVLGAASNNFAMNIMATEALSTKDVSLENAITIFPNPVKDEATIAFQDIINPTQAKIFDIHGKQVLQKYTYNLENNFKMDLSGLSNGVYFLHFESEEGTIVKQLLKA